MLKTGQKLRLSKKKSTLNLRVWNHDPTKTESTKHCGPVYKDSVRKESHFWQKLCRAAAFDLPDNWEGVIMEKYTQNTENILATSKHLLKGNSSLINISMSKLSLKLQLFIRNKLHSEKDVLLPNSLGREKEKKKLRGENNTHNKNFVAKYNNLISTTYRLLFKRKVKQSCFSLLALI